MNLLLDTHAFLWFMEGSERSRTRRTGRGLLSGPEAVPSLAA